MAEQTMTKKKGLKKGWRIVLGILAGLILLYAVLGYCPGGRTMPWRTR